MNSTVFICARQHSQQTHSFQPSLFRRTSCCVALGLTFCAWFVTTPAVSSLNDSTLCAFYVTWSICLFFFPRLFSLVVDSGTVSAVTGLEPSTIHTCGQLDGQTEGEVMWPHHQMVLAVFFSAVNSLLSKSKEEPFSEKQFLELKLPSSDLKFPARVLQTWQFTPPPPYIFWGLLSKKKLYDFFCLLHLWSHVPSFMKLQISEP